VRWLNLAGLLLTWLIVIAFFVAYISYSTGDRANGLAFASRDNLETVFRQTSIVGFAAIGVTFIIVCGMIDLSIGSVVALTTVILAWLLQKRVNPTMAAAAGVVSGIVAGAINGQLINRLKLSPFIVTLGTLLIFRGIAKGLANNQKIDAPFTWLADILAKLSPESRWQIFPLGVWLLIIFAILATLLLERTVFGRNLTAVGANEEAARLAGISPESTRNKVFALGGLFIGFAGLMQFSRLTVGDPTVATGLELDVIAAVVVGGASLSGGQGTIAGSLLGALIISTIRAGCSQAGFPNNIQEIVTGCIIIAALAVDRLRKKNYA
jgi:ribose/xylose/arabinose/galactoside ABC-type transport system permease subunit